MTRRGKIAAFIVATAVAGAVALYFNRDGLGPTGSAPTTAAHKASSPAPLNSPTPPTTAPPNTAPAAPSPASDAEVAMVVGNTGERFHVDAKGQLVQNEKTRLHIEALVALTAPDKLYDAVQDEVRNLPRSAGERAAELVERYKVYIDDQKKLYPPGVAPVNMDEMQAQIDGLHALRVAHFGAQTAEAFFGEEEAVNRELLELMRNETDPTLSMEEKAERAQAMRDKLQRLKEIESANQQSAPTQPSGTK